MVPENFSPRFFNRPRFKPIVERIAHAVQTKTPFSMIRLGDGEGPVLCWPDFKSPDDMALVFRRWFGHSDLSPSDLDTIAEGLRAATRSADVLGISTHYQLAKTPRYGMVLQGIEHYHLDSPSQIMTDSAFHWYLQWSGAIAYLLRGLPQVSVIGCRDIGPQIAETFGIGTVRTYLVRGEHKAPGTITLPHWPDGFAEVMRQLDVIPPGSIFLVAAGVLGKIYCDRIKAKGGVALDIGALLDSWANVPSRARYVTFPAEFTLEYFKTVGQEWDQMLAALDRCAKEVHAVDSTITY
jgi:hypothetical protein